MRHVPDHVWDELEERAEAAERERDKALQELGWLKQEKWKHEAKLARVREWRDSLPLLIRDEPKRELDAILDGEDE